MANSDKNISSAVIKRLPRYFRYLGALKSEEYYKNLFKRIK